MLDDLGRRMCVAAGAAATATALVCYYQMELDNEEFYADFDAGYALICELHDRIVAESSAKHRSKRVRGRNAIRSGGLWAEWCLAHNNSSWPSSTNSQANLLASGKTCAWKGRPWTISWGTVACGVQELYALALTACLSTEMCLAREIATTRGGSFIYWEKVLACTILFLGSVYTFAHVRCSCLVLSIPLLRRALTSHGIPSCR